MSSSKPWDDERHPGLSDDGRRVLDALCEHPHAPIFRNRSGHRLLPDDLADLRCAEHRIVDFTFDWQPGLPPSWIDEFVETSLHRVPFYRNYGAPPSTFELLPTIDRGDLAADVARFVPDDLSTERLIIFQTSGTTGHPLLLPSHPQVAALYLPHHKRALRRFGIELRHGRDQVGVILLGMQARCFTYVSVTPTMNESGLAKINLHPNDWRQPHDRAKYLEAMQAEILAGDPISFTELLDIDPDIHPAALLSTSMTLSSTLKRELQTRFGCPVLDLYSMNEAGPIAVFDDALGGHVLLQPRLYVEILDARGNAVPSGVRGEITLTGGFNFCLPLLRYRTGDYASLERRGDDLVLIDLAGRPPVRYRTAQNRWINNVDFTHALRSLPIRQFALHQDTAGTLHVRYSSTLVTEPTVRAALQVVVGADTALRIERVTDFPDKVVQYTSALADSHVAQVTPSR